MSRVKRVAIIPARGGSKRLPLKNIKEVDGHPLIGYTISETLRSGVFDTVVVSSDDPQILAIGAEYGAEPLRRPAQLAADESPLFPACEHLLDTERAQGRTYDQICLLMPNCPLRVAEDIRASLEAFETRELEFQISVTPYHWHYPFWALKETSDGGEFFFGRDYLKRSQELPDVYCPTGAVWWAQVAPFLDAKNFYGPGYGLFQMAWERAVDIDDRDDWEQFLTMRAGLVARGFRVAEARVIA